MDKKEKTIIGAAIWPLKVGLRAKILMKGGGALDTSPVVAISEEGYFSVKFETENTQYTLLIDHDLDKDDNVDMKYYRSLMEVS
ncbi:MAG: hypothetical protein J5850_04275 [Clostridia bacterium]|nr:hypothetical protein [Clostridia bacterium]